MYGQFYNQGYYPNNFNQMYQMQQYQNNQPQQMQTQQAQNQQTDERIWVQGEESAKAYLVAPNSFVRLWDSQAPVFYEKRADQSGKPYMDVRMIDKLKDKLCEELETVSRKTTMNAGDLEMMHKLTDTIKNLDKIAMLEGESNYGNSRGSYRGGDWDAHGSYGNDSYRHGSYNDGGYSGRGRHYVRGHYSYAEGKEELKKQMESMMEDMSLSNEDRNRISRAMAELR